MAFPLAAAIPAVASLVGGIMGKKATDDANQTQRDLAGLNVDVQREFAQQGVRWRVEDAKKAGIHPLVALGAQTTSFSPVSVGTAPNTSMANAVSNMGQDISRAVQATRTSQERTMADLQLQGARLDVEGKAIDNQIKNSQLQKMNSTGPSFPGSQSFIPGQGDTQGRIQNKPLERTMSSPNDPSSEPGALAERGWMITAKGGLAPIPSGDAKQRLEDSPNEWVHFYRNNVLPNVGRGVKPPADALPKGYKDWEWDYEDQSYFPVRSKARTLLQRGADYHFPGVRQRFQKQFK